MEADTGVKISECDLRNLNICIKLSKKGHAEASEWCTSTGGAGGEHTKKVSLANLKQWIHKAIDTAYLALGNAILRQTKGVPMGMNPSPYLAELFLFMYELAFMEQMINKDAQHKKAFLDYFSAVCRYQDDKWTGDNTQMRKAKYTTKYWGLTTNDVVDAPDALHPLRGIYPDCLVIKNEQCSRSSVHYLDLSVSKVCVQPAVGIPTASAFKFKTAVYNKRDEQAYKDMPMVIYPQVDTMLSKQCKYGIVYSQAHCFMQCCSFRSDFDAALKELVVYLVNTKGYSKTQCLKQVKKFCHRYRHKFGICSGQKSIWAVSKAVNQQCQS